ncbi:hypothetical protein [Cohnella yongneupensis]|uniref:DUF4179 domain-containing protein n=1 Tax=Cohnella yongneupensis TaxID=425006 RepID=A0ABW0R260_9BACL
MDSDNLKEQVGAIPIPAALRDRSRLGIGQAASERSAGSGKRRMAMIAALLGVILLSATLANRTTVWAAIQRALQFVPGIGVVEKEDPQSAQYVMNQPITIEDEDGEGSIVITGFLSDDQMTLIMMAGDHMADFEQVKIVNEQGEAFTVDRSLVSFSSGEWTASYWHDGKLDVRGDVKLILQTKPEIEVSAHLSEAKAHAGYADLGATVRVNGVSITAITDRVGEKARVSLVSPPMEKGSIMDYGISGVYLHGEADKLNVVDGSGKKLAIETIRAMMSPQREFYFPLSADASLGYTLTIPEISVTYNDETTVKMPAETREQLEQTFEIAGFPVTITGTDRIADDSLRVYLDLHYDEAAASSLYNFDIEAVSSMAKMKEQTGAIEYIEVPVEPGAKTVSLKFIRPTAVVRGPWTLDLKAEDFIAAE